MKEPFASSMRSLLGEAAFEQFERALEAPSSVSIRLNPTKWTERPAAYQRVPWAEEGYYLDARPAFTFDPLFHAGAYYVQEASSMFLEQAVRRCVDGPVALLDLCAAPGGKSTLLRSLLPEGSLLVTNEPLRPRVQVLAENVTKWGHPDVVVTNNYPAEFAPLESFFDVIATDVPCSGEGMFRKDNPAEELWSEANVEQCWQRQRSIIEDVWPALKPGGYLIYSTCTYNMLEDEDNVRWIADTLGAETVEIPLNPAWQVTGNLQAGNAMSVYHFLPHLTRGEGFFLAVLKKKGDGEEPITEKKRKKSSTSFQTLPAECKTWLKEPSAYVCMSMGELRFAIPKMHAERISRLIDVLKIQSVGVPLAKEKGRKLVPAHGLALSNAKSDVAFPTVEITYPMALAYLRTEALVLPSATPRGYVLLTYRGQALGFVNNIGSRANNLYPSEWRIRSGYSPDDEVSVI